MGLVVQIPFVTTHGRVVEDEVATVAVLAIPDRGPGMVIVGGKDRPSRVDLSHDLRPEGVLALPPGKLACRFRVEGKLEGSLNLVVEHAPDDKVKFRAVLQVLESLIPDAILTEVSTIEGIDHCHS